MKLTDFTRDVLRYRRETRDLTKEGWERVDEGGGKLWELTRGCRYRHVIVAARPASDGKSIWIKTEPRP